MNQITALHDQCSPPRNAQENNNWNRAKVINTNTLMQSTWIFMKIIQNTEAKFSPEEH